MFEILDHQQIVLILYFWLTHAVDRYEAPINVIWVYTDWSGPVITFLFLKCRAASPSFVL